MSESVSKARRISPLFPAMVLIALLLCITAIYQGLEAYGKGDYSTGNLFITMGVTTLALLTYMLLQTRRRVFRPTLRMQPVTTTIMCQKCGLKNIRDFQRGDYIFKEAEQCPKCNEKMTITSIYREVKERGREERYS